VTTRRSTAKIDEAFVDAALRSLGAADSYFHSGLQNVRRVACADDTGQSQLATDDGAVTRATAAIGDLSPQAFFMIGSHAGSVIEVTSTSPALNSAR